MAAREAADDADRRPLAGRRARAARATSRAPARDSVDRGRRGRFPRGVDVQPEILFDAGRRARSVWLNNAPSSSANALKVTRPFLGSTYTPSGEVAADDVEVPFGVELPPEVLALLRATRVFVPPGRATRSVQAPVDAGHGQLPFPRAGRAGYKRQVPAAPGSVGIHCTVGCAHAVDWRPDDARDHSRDDSRVVIAPLPAAPMAP